MGITMDSTHVARIGTCKMGRSICPICEEPYEEDNFWIELKKFPRWYRDIVTLIYLTFSIII
jgi:hypothetical protein